MAISGRELQLATEAARLLFEQLGYVNWSFSVEPHFDSPWELRVECAAPDGWRAYSFPVNAEELVRSLTDEPTRQRLLAEWTRRLSCATSPSPPQTR